MAKALQCPSCHTKHRLDGVTQVATFKCTKCGQRLKVPPSLQGGAAGRTVGRTVSATAGAGGAPAPPRRRPRPSTSTGDGAPRKEPTPTGKAPKVPTPTPVAAAASTAAMASTPVARPAVPTSTPLGGRSTKKPARDALPLPLRLGAWLLALPVGLILVGLPSRKLGYLTGQKLLDVIVKHDTARFVPLLVIVALWALATAVLVELFCEGGRWWMLRRRRSQDGGGANGLRGGPGPSGVTLSPPPSRRGRSVPARRGS